MSNTHHPYGSSISLFPTGCPFQQPVVTVVRMRLTEAAVQETVELALSQLPDLVLLRDVVKFFQEVQ